MSTATLSTELELAELLVREPTLTAEEGRRLLGIPEPADREDEPTLTARGRVVDSRGASHRVVDEPNPR